MKKLNFIMLLLIFFVGILSFVGFFDFVDKSNDFAGLLNTITGLNESSSVAGDGVNKDCSADFDCSGSASIPVVIWLFCCCMIGLAGYKRRKIKPEKP